MRTPEQQRERAVLQLRIEMDEMLPVSEYWGGYTRDLITCTRCGAAVKTVSRYLHFTWHKKNDRIVVIHESDAHKIAVMHETVAALFGDLP